TAHRTGTDQDGILVEGTGINGVYGQRIEWIVFEHEEVSMRLEDPANFGQSPGMVFGGDMVEHASGKQENYWTGIHRYPCPVIHRVRCCRPVASAGSL